MFTSSKGKLSVLVLEWIFNQINRMMCKHIHNLGICELIIIVKIRVMVRVCTSFRVKSFV